MKKVLSIALLSVSVILFSCNQAEQKGSHTHDDGSTHTDHTADTTKPVQEEFIAKDSLKTDTSSKEHSHEDGKNHAH